MLFLFFKKKPSYQGAERQRKETFNSCSLYYFFPCLCDVLLSTFHTQTRAQATQDARTIHPPFNLDWNFFQNFSIFYFWVVCGSYGGGVYGNSKYLYNVQLPDNCLGYRNSNLLQFSAVFQHLNIKFSLFLVSLLPSLPFPPLSVSIPPPPLPSSPLFYYNLLDVLPCTL